MIKEYGFMKDRELTNHDYRDIAMNLEFKEVNEFERVIEFND